MVKYSKSFKYFQWLFYLALFLIVVGVYFTHFSYLQASTSEKTWGTFWLNSKAAFVDLKNTLYNQIFITPINLDEIDIPIFKLFVREDNIDKLNSQLPNVTYFGVTEAPKDNVQGYLVYGNETYSSRVRYRGDTYIHWRFPKKSWRVKLENKTILNGSNKLNFINPKFDSHMNTQLSYYMGEKMGLLVPRSYHMVLFLNNNYQGVYYYTDQIDETFLRMKNEMPGNIYFGEFGANTMNYLFNDSKVWDIAATKNGNEDEAREELDFFLKSIENRDDVEFYRFFNRYLGEEYIKFDALTMLVGSYQPDQFHNHKFYLDPTNGVFRPIPWDLIPFIDEHLNLSLNYYNNPLILKMHLTPELINKRDELIYYYMNNELSEDKLIEVVDEWEKKIEYEMAHDKFKDANQRPYVLTTKGWKKAVDELREDIKERYKFLRETLDNVNVTIYVANDKIIFDVIGESAVKLKTKNFEDILYPGRSLDKEPDWEKIFGNELNYSILRYEYKKEFDISDIELVNSVTGKEVIPKIIYLKNINELPEVKSDSVHPWLLKQEEGKEIIMDKNIVLTKDLVLGKDDVLVIKPGVTISLGPSVSIISYGQIIAKGTAERPITFMQNNKGVAWGSIVMQGIDRERAKPNYFSYCVFDGGSGESYEHVVYTAQVGVYNSKAYFDHCKFLNNLVEDDNFGAKKSYIEIDSCEFENSLSDGIDFDITDGEIVNTKIISSGDDGIDSMTSYILIENNEIVNSGGKGISVGEKSKPLILNNKITNSAIGIAIKDMSEPIVSNNEINSNKVGIAAYHKIWRYEYGGRGKIYKNNLNLNQEDYSVDENLTIINNYTNILSNSSSLQFFDEYYTGD